MKITVAGLGYVGLSNAVLLAQHHEVTAYDILSEKVTQIQNKISPIADDDIQDYLANKTLNLTVTDNTDGIYEDADFIIIATPTNYNPETNYFDTSSIETVLDDAVTRNDHALMIIKSTIPVGYTQKARERYKTDRIIFVPEFLREGKALYDNLYPTRIVIGDKSERAEKIKDLFLSGALKKDTPVVFTNVTEAEAVKLFANTFLALRVAYFNELDTYAEIKGLNTKDIVEGIGYDPRIGDYYNNPSFGYGGYCLPKDTKQLMANYSDVPNEIIGAVVEANRTRKDHITEMILKRNPKSVGIFRLTMKKDSDNIRSSAVLGILKRLAGKGISVFVYEPTLKTGDFMGAVVVNDIEELKMESDLIITNRMSDELKDVMDKVYTRDIFNNN